MSECGPTERVRHLCHVLTGFMDAYGGNCFPSQRTLGIRLGLSHKLAGRIARSAQASGWIELEEVRRQYGRVGHRYYAAAPEAVISDPKFKLSRPASHNGTTHSPNPDVQWDNAGSQSANGTASHFTNGTTGSGIGTAEPKIGTTQDPGLLLTLTERGAASPSPVATGSAAQDGSKDPEAIREQRDKLRAAAGLRPRRGDPAKLGADRGSADGNR